MARRLTGRFEARPMASINLTPMVPVLLALFVMVLVVGQPSGPTLRHDQPPSDCFGVCKPIHGFFVSLRSDGAAYVGERQVRDDQVVALLREQTRGLDTYSLGMRADADVPYGRVFAMMAQLRAAGLNRPEIIGEDLH
jgi:biopolymer transport protein ExbD